jgi:hypothetical protein
MKSIYFALGKGTQLSRAFAMGPQTQSLERITGEQTHCVAHLAMQRGPPVDFGG